MKRMLISLLLCPLLINAGLTCSKEGSPEQSKSVIPAAPAPHINYTMRSTPDNDRTVDLKLTWHILSEDIDNLPDNDPRVIASYCAVFRNCKNGISNLAPATATYIKNPDGYTLTPIIKSMACEKHLGSTVSLQYTTQKKDGEEKERRVRLDFSGESPLTDKDPTNPMRHMLILLSEVKKDEEKK